MKKLPQLAMITWEDAVFTRAEMTLDEAKKEKGLIYHTVGFLVNKNENYTILSHEIGAEANDSNERVRGTSTIPNSYIKRIVYLGQSEKDEETTV